MQKDKAAQTEFLRKDVHVEYINCVTFGAQNDFTNPNLYIEMNVTHLVYIFAEVGVDVFYEIPLHGSPDRYMYQIINCPVNSNFRMTFPHGTWESVCDWPGIMGQYLGTLSYLSQIFT